MMVKRIVAPRQQLAPVLALAAPACADAAGKRTATEAARPRFTRGTAVMVRHRLARAPLYGRWMVVVDSAVSGTNDDFVRYPACSDTGPSGRMASVPAAYVREARLTPAAAKRESPESSTDGASCKKAKLTGQEVPMDALLRYPDAEFLPAPKQP